MKRFESEQRVFIPFYLYYTQTKFVAKYVRQFLVPARYSAVPKNIFPIFLNLKVCAVGSVKEILFISLYLQSFYKK